MEFSSITSPVLVKKSRSLNILLAVLFLLHGLLLFWNISGMEFYGEDESGTALVNARTVLGLLTGNADNMAAAIGDSHPPLRNLVQAPFLALLGVKELAIFLPHILASLGVFALLLQIGKTFLKPSGMVFLAVLYTCSAIYAYNRSPNGFGLFLFFEIAAFSFSLRWERSGTTLALATAWFLAALACLTYLEGSLFVPYLLVVTFLPIRVLPWRERMRKGGPGLAVFSLPILIYGVVFYLLPFIVLGKPVGNWEHLLQRQGQLSFTNNLVVFWEHLTTMFNLPLALLLLGSFMFSIFQIRRLPSDLHRFSLFFSLHLITWLFFFTQECGHTLMAYPYFFLNAAYVLQQLEARFRPFFVLNKLFRAGFVMIAGYSLVYAFHIFSDLTPIKNLPGAAFQPEILPCGLNYAHRVGLKSAAYWIRMHSSPTDLFLGDTGETMSQFYLDRPSPALSFTQAMSALRVDPSMDLNARYGIRFIGLNAALAEFDTTANFLSSHFSPVLTILGERGAVSYQVWDLNAAPPVQPEVIGMIEYNELFDRQFCKISVRFSRWHNYLITQNAEE